MPRSKSKVRITVASAVILIAGASLAWLYQYRVAQRPQQHEAAARQAEQLEHWEQAAKHWAYYASLRPEDTDAYCAYARAVLNMAAPTSKQVALAASALHDAIRLDPSRTEPYAKLTELLCRAGAYDDAAYQVNRWIEHAPTDIDALRVRALVLERQAKYAAAIEAYDAVLVAHPDAFDAADKWVELAQLVGWDEQVIQDRLDAIVIAFPNSERPLLLRFGYLFDRNNAHALDDLKRAKELAPNSTEVLFADARAARKQRDRKREEAILRRAIVLDPTAPGSHLALGRCLLETGRHQQALDTYQKGLAVAEDRRDLLFVLADAELVLDKHQAATRHIAELRHLEPGSARLDLLDGRTALAEQHLADALPLLERVVAKAPETAMAHLLLGKCYWLMGDHRRAFAGFVEAVRLHPESAEAKTELLKLTTQSNQFMPAGDAILNLLRSSPNDYRLVMAAANALVNTKVPDAQRAAHVERIFDLLNHAGRLNPVATEPLTLKAELLREQGQAEHVVILLESLTEIPAVRARALQVLAVHYVKVNQPDRARETLERINTECEDDSHARIAKATILANLASYAPAIEVLHDDLVKGDRQRRLRIANILLELFDQPATPGRPSAIDQIHVLADLAPPDVELLSKLIKLAADINDWPWAEHLVGQIREIEGDDGWIWRLKLATILLQKTPHAPATPESLALLNELAEQQECWTQAQLMRGAALESIGDFESAIAAYERIVECDPNEIVGHIRLIELLVARQRYEQADRLLTDLIARGFDGPPIRALQVRRALRIDDDEAAILHLQRYLDIAPSDATALVTAAVVYRRTGRTNKALEVIAKAIELEPALVNAHLELARTYALANRRDEALGVVEEYLQRTPGADAHLLAANVYATMNERTGVEEHCTRAIALGANDKRMTDTCIDLLDRVGSPMAAQLLESSTIVSANSSDVDNHSNDNLRHRRLAKHLLSRGGQSDLERIEQVAADWTHSAPGDLMAKLLRITATKEHGLVPWRPKQISALETLRDENPEFIPARRVLAGAYLATGRLEAAEEQIRIILGVWSTDEATLSLSAELNLLKNRPQDALEQAKRAAAIAHHNPQAQLLVAKCLLATGRISDAQSSLTGVLGGDTSHVVRRAATLLLLECLIRTDAWDQVDTHVASFLKNPDDRSIIVATIAGAAQRQSSLDRAESWVRSVIERYPHDARLLLSLAKVLAVSPNASQRSAEIRNLFLRATNDSQIAADAFADLGSFELQIGRPDQAETAFRQAITRQADHVTAINNLAWLLHESGGDATEALQLAEQATRLTPWRGAFHHTRGAILARVERFDDAAAAFRDAIEAGYQTAQVYSDLENVLRAKGDEVTARQVAMEARRAAKRRHDTERN